VTLASPHYLFNITHTENGEKVIDNYNVSDTGLILSNPLWGENYFFSALCFHPILGPINCGNWVFEAMVQTTPVSYFTILFVVLY